MHLTVRDFVVMTLTALGFSYVIIYGIVFAPSIHTRLLFLCFILIFAFLLWLSFNPYIKILYALLGVWSGWASSPLLIALAEYFNLPYVSGFLAGLGEIPLAVHVVIGTLSFAVLILHYLDRRKSIAIQERDGEHGNDPKLIELIIYALEGFRKMYNDKDKVAVYLFFLLSGASLTLFSILFYLQRILPIPEISDDLVVFSIAITSAVVTGEIARNYRRVFHYVSRVFVSVLVFCSIGGLATACIFIIERYAIGEICHSFNAFKVGQILLCAWISWLGAQLGAAVGAHERIEQMLANPKKNGGIWEMLLVGEYAKGSAILSTATFAAFVLGFLSEVSHGSTNCVQNL